MRMSPVATCILLPPISLLSDASQVAIVPLIGAQ